MIKNNRNAQSKLSQTNKRKRGLSLSLQKKCSFLKITTDWSINNTKCNIQNNPNQESDFHNLSSGKKNKIKYVQGYRDNQSGSKYKKAKYFKVIDEDLKLGGKKPFNNALKMNKNHLQQNLFTLNNTISFPNCSKSFVREPFQIVNGETSRMQTDRRVLRDSNLANIQSNMHYFQNIKIDEKTYRVDSSQPQTNTNFTFKQNKIINIDQYKPSQIKAPALNPNNRAHKTEQKVTHNSQNTAPIQVQYLQSSLKREKLKQATLEKLKRVERKIDQLLSKASETKQMILKTESQSIQI